MHHLFEKGGLSHELVRVSNEFECRYELIYQLLERLLRVLNNLQETICLLAVLYWESISLSKLSGHIYKGCDTARQSC